MGWVTPPVALGDVSFLLVDGSKNPLPNHRGKDGAKKTRRILIMVDLTKTTFTSTG